MLGRLMTAVVRSWVGLPGPLERWTLGLLRGADRRLLLELRELLEALVPVLGRGRWRWQRL